MVKFQCMCKRLKPFFLLFGLGNIQIFTFQPDPYTLPYPTIVPETVKSYESDWNNGFRERFGIVCVCHPLFEVHYILHLRYNEATVLFAFKYITVTWTEYSVTMATLPLTDRTMFWTHCQKQWYEVLFVTTGAYWLFCHSSRPWLASNGWVTAPTIWWRMVMKSSLLLRRPLGSCLGLQCWTRMGSVLLL